MAINRLPNGFRLFTGQLINQIIDIVNGTAAGVFTGVFNGTVGATTPSTASVTNLTQNGTLKRVPQRIAAAGSNSQSGSTAITKALVLVVTVSASTRGVRLPTASTGLQVQVQNCGATSLSVYPATGARIGTAATNAKGTLAKRKGTIYTAQSATTWETLAGA